MAVQENHFTVFIRLPFKRGDFVDPPPVAWSATKERELWDVISRQVKGQEIDWATLAEQFQVTQQFLLQQAAWLYERQLSHVRAQMRRMGSRSSATASPAPGSAAASMISATPARRPLGVTSRGPSRLSTQTSITAAPIDSSGPNTPARSKTSLPLKSVPSGTANSSTRGQPTVSRPLSRKPSKDNDSNSRTHSRRGSIQQQLTKSPANLSSSSSADETTGKSSHRRSTLSSTHRRTSSGRKSQHAKTSSLSVNKLREQQEEDEDDDDPAFLPFANTSSRTEQASITSTDPSATLRGNLTQAAATSLTSTRPNLQRNPTSERVRPASTTSTAQANITKGTSKQKDILQPQYHHQLTSSTSSLSSSNSPYPPNPIPSRLSSAPPAPTPQSTTNPPTQRSSSTTTATNPQGPSLPRPQAESNLPTPLSPRQQAALAAAAGLSPRGRSAAPPTRAQGHNHTHTGSESSPSMGSSFSDLDDASVTQSALEEALMSNMNALGSTAGIGGLGSRVSGISQALRSRYFDARGQPAAGRAGGSPGPGPGAGGAGGGNGG